MNSYHYYPQNIPLKWFTKHNGLDSGQVHNITQDNKGIIWLSGPNGLSRYNGNCIENFTKRLNLSTHGLRWIEIAPENVLFILTDIDIELISEGTSYTITNNWQIGFINNIAFHSALGLIVASNMGVYIYRNHEFTKMLSGNFEKVFVDQLNHVWVCEQFAALKIYNSEFTSLIKVGFDEIKDISYISESHDNKTILVTNDYILELKNFTIIRTTDISLVSAVIEQNNNLWVGVNNQLVKYSLFDDKWCKPEIICDDCYINSFFIDNFNNIWGATDQHGAIKVSALKDMVFQPKFKTKGSVFSINKIDESRYSFIGRNVNKEVKINNIYFFKDNLNLNKGHVWDQIYINEHLTIVVSDEGVHRIYDGEIKQIFKQDKYLSKHGRIIYRSGELIWIGTRLGLTKLIIDSNNDLTIIQQFNLGYVYCIDKDHKNNLWVGTINNGLWIEQESDFIQHKLRFIEDNSGIYCLRFNEKYDCVILHDNFISIHQIDGTSTLITETKSLVSGWSVVWDNGTIWVGSSNGLTQYDVSLKEEKRNITALLSESNWEFTTSKSLMIVDNRFLLCGLNSGLAIVDKNILNKIQKELKIYLDVVTWDNTETQMKGNITTVNPGNWTLEIRYYSIWYYNEQNLKYRYKLLGFDNKWHITKYNHIQYNSLPVGKYKLIMEVFSPLTGWSESFDIYEFKVEIPFWARGWLTLAYNSKEIIFGVFSNKKKNSDLIQLNQHLEEKLLKNTNELTKTYIEIQKANVILKKEANLDALTGIANRRAFNFNLNKELEISTRSNSALSLLFVDIDNFKFFNDNYGHDVGDIVLINLADVLKQNIRKGDYACRYGGEEFAIILPHTSLIGAKKIASKLIKEVSKMEVRNTLISINKKITISVGISVFDDLNLNESNVKELIKQADQGLYIAKHNGKNQFATIVKE
jgi:diguanylate cyclase (GGDEF)-like protein